MTKAMNWPTSSPTSEYATHEELRHKIELAVVAHDAPGVLQLLAADTNVGLTVLGSGFGGGTNDFTRNSFARYCMANQAVPILETVLRSNLADPSQLLRDSCTWMFSDSAPNDSVVPNPKCFQTLAYSAMQMRNSAGTLLAIELESADPKMKYAYFSLNYRIQMTYHAEALRNAMGVRESSESMFMGGVDVCRAYVKHKLPAQILAPGMTDPRDGALYEFVCAPGAKHPAAFVDLFRDYLAAGYFGDLNARLPNGSADSGVSNKLPLTGAILMNNREIAVELVLAGADVTSIGEDAGYPGLGVAELALSLGRVDSAEFAAALTHALMSRHIGAGARLKAVELAPEMGRARRRGVKGSV